MDGQDVQTLCCENQALAAQTLRCLGTPVVKIQEEGVGPRAAHPAAPCEAEQRGHPVPRVLVKHLRWFRAHSKPL